MSNEWQPIETSPRNHTRILLFVPPYGSTTGHWDCLFGDDGWNMHAVLNKSAEPTHWMPLPDPPKESE